MIGKQSCSFYQYQRAIECGRKRLSVGEKETCRLGLAGRSCSAYSAMPLMAQGTRSATSFQRDPTAASPREREGKMPSLFFLAEQVRLSPLVHPNLADGSVEHAGGRSEGSGDLEKECPASRSIRSPSGQAQARRGASQVVPTVRLVCSGSGANS
jgi:hypothetical protein